MPPGGLIKLINRYFDCRVPAIEAREGEVNKFMGGGQLAIFPIAYDDLAKVGNLALAATRNARATLLALEREEAREFSSELSLSLGLHVGEVLYGNVGSGSRRDFTVIGPAVYLVAQLERLARNLGRSVITSSEFADASGEHLTPLGRFALRGFDAPQPTFGLPEEVTEHSRNP